ncbi:O-antigen ligase family protein [Devosia sp. SL43]|uniref:O-antigen ligase family protein n=1 Tax=Devosia sp. SL43 TaxID=2806348 RepID=UPI001F31E49C|nr:O-antigen ligase family protein [Devosia sp. SL43]UJW87437.1 O-antigen ligase family protein [Devosia sp. SL43]
MTAYAHPSAMGSVRAPVIEFNIAACLTSVSLGVLLLNPLFGGLAALIFLLCGGLLMATKIPHTIQSLARFWYVLLLPVYCALSTLWSQAPAETFRGSLQLCVSVAIAIVIACRVPPRTLVRILFGIFLMAIIASVLFGRVRNSSGAWIGIFGSKNAFAAIVSVFILTSVAALVDKEGSRLQRVTALISLVVSGPILLLAQSAGAIIMLMPSLGAMLFVLSGRWLTPLQRAVLLCVVGMLAVIASLLAVGYWSELMNLVLNTTGKDTTLTGRTDLWAVGIDLIRENPLFGVGYRAFWLQGYSPAEILWAQFGIASRSGFNFHNTYISNAVEIGTAGVTIQVAMLFGAFFLALKWGLRDPSPATALFLGYLTTAVFGSFVEVSLFFQFSLPTTLVVVALVYGVRASSP